MHTSHSAYRCIFSELLLTWFYFRNKFTATLWWPTTTTTTVLSPHPLHFKHFYFMWFVSDQAYINLCVPKALPPSIFTMSFLPSFSMTHFLASCCNLITFFQIEIFILALCSKPLELYLHSFLKHNDIIIFSYFLSQKTNITCVI